MGTSSKEQGIEINPIFFGPFNYLLLSKFTAIFRETSQVLEFSTDRKACIDEFYLHTYLKEGPDSLDRSAGWYHGDTPLESINYQTDLWQPLHCFQDLILQSIWKVNGKNKVAPLPFE